LFIVSPVRDDHRRFQAETPLIDLFKFAEPTLSLNRYSIACSIAHLPTVRRTVDDVVGEIRDLPNFKAKSITLGGECIRLSVTDRGIINIASASFPCLCLPATVGCG
jgi:hypothetical protein